MLHLDEGAAVAAGRGAGGFGRPHAEYGDATLEEAIAADGADAEGALVGGAGSTAGGADRATAEGEGVEAAPSVALAARAAGLGGLGSGADEERRKNAAAPLTTIAGTAIIAHLRGSDLRVVGTRLGGSSIVAARACLDERSTAVSVRGVLTRSSRDAGSWMIVWLVRAL